MTAGQRVAERERGKRTVPSWLVSFVFHLALLLVLALIPIPGLMKGSLTLFFGQSDEPGIAEFELGGTDGFDVDLPTEPTLPSFDLVDPSETMETIDLSSLIKSDTPTTAIESLESLQQAIANGLSGRSGANKAALLARWGSPETEDAVELGLEWLAKQQKSNGSWSLIGPYASGGVYENTTAATALALNAFLGAGYTHREGKYSENVTLGLKYLTRRQDRKGFFAEKEPSRQQMYAQAIATITICEALGMTEDYDLLQYAERAIEFAEFSQSRLHGWRYEPQRDADVSVTGWFVMALETGKMAGLTVDEEKLQEVHQFLDSVGYDEMSQYAYNDLEGPSLSMTAEGMLIRILLGWPKSHPALLDAVQEQFVPTRPQADDEEQSIYYWYYATQVMHHFGGEPWEIWNQAMKSAIPAMQQKSGPEKGSWDPARDIYGASGGRLYTTCLSIYCLEVYYRHLAIYGTE